MAKRQEKSPFQKRGRGERDIPECDGFAFKTLELSALFCIDIFIHFSELCVRPKLKFENPRDTEEFVLSQDKTDYTYSRSPSYSLESSDSNPSMDSYEIPYMSRRSIRGSRAPPMVTPQRRQPSVEPASSRRRSARLAGRPLEDPRSLNMSTQYPSNARLKPGGGRPIATEPRHGSTRDMAPLYKPSSNSSTSGLFSERDYPNKEQSLTHIYGLDEYDDPEISDTESSQANRKLSSSSDGTDTSSSDWSERRSSMDPIEMVKMLVLTTIYIITYLPRTIYRHFQSNKLQQTPPLSRPSTFGQAVFSFFHAVSHTLYTLVASSLLFDVWVLTRTRVWLSSLGIATPVTAGFKQASFTSLSSSSSEQTQHHERRRRGRGFPCWLFLLFLLLPFLTSLYLFWGFVPFLMPLARNETNETESLAIVGDGMSVILASLGDDEAGPSSAAAGAAAGGLAGMAGCLQCLRREDLVTIVAGLMKDNTEDLQHQILEQNKQILLMLKHGSEQEKKIHQLQLQVDRFKKQASSHKVTGSLSGDISLEEEVAQVRAEIRSIVHDETAESQRDTDSVSAFKADMDRLSNKIANLNKAFEESKSSQGVLEVSLRESGLEMEEPTKEVMRPIHDLQDKFTSQLGELEGRLNDFSILVGVYEASGENKEDQRKSLVQQINVLERDVIDLKSILKQLEEELERLKDEVDGKDSETVTSLKNDLETERVRVRDLELQLSRQIEDAETVKLEVQSFKDEIATVVERTQTVEENAMRDKELFGVLLQKTSESNTQQIEALSSKVEAKFKSLHAENRGSDSDTVVALRQSIQTNSDRIDRLKSADDELITSMGSLPGDVKRNADALISLQDALTSLSSALNGSDGLEPMRPNRGKPLTVVRILQAVQNDLQSLRSKVDGMHSLQDSVTGSESVSEAALAQVAGLQLTTNRMERDVGEASKSMEVIRSEVEELRSSLDLLVDRTVSPGGNPIDFVDLESDVESLLATIAVLHGEVNDLKEEHNQQAAVIASMRTENSEVRELFTSDKGETVNFVTMQSHFNTFQTDLSKLETSVSSLKAEIGEQDKKLGLVLTDRDQQYDASELGAIKADIVNMKATVANIERGDSGGVVPLGFADLESKVSSMEAGLIALQSDRDEGYLAEEVAALKQQVAALQQSQESMSNKSGAGVAAGLLSDDDITNLKSDLTKLNAQYNSLNMNVNECCNNKSADIMGFGFGPAYGVYGGGAAASNGNVTEDTKKIQGIVYGILNMYSADKTGMVDYALESAGGSIVSTRCSETFTSKTALLSIFGIPLWYVTNSPRTVIQPDVNPGNCWAFRGAIGFLVIQLSDTIKPTYFTMEHIPKSLSPTGEIPSAPKNFSVWSLKDEYDKDGVLLGEYVYNDEGPSVQVFPVQDVEVKPTMMVELKIHSNYGSLEYTCLYRFRVHGKLYRP